MSYWPLLFSVFPIWSFFGNLLVIVSIWRDKQLHNITNYCVVNLALADLFISIFSWPLSIYLKVNDGRWYLGEDLCAFFSFFTGIPALGSAFTIVTISVDRLLAVRCPIIYRSISHRLAIGWLVFTWILMIPMLLPALFKINKLPDPTICGYSNGKYVTILSIFSFWLPLIVMISAYSKISSVLKKRRKSKRRTPPPATGSGQSQSSNLTSGTSGIDSQRSSVDQAVIVNIKGETIKADSAIKCQRLDRKANRTMIMVVAVFLVCYAPVYLAGLAQWIAGEFPPSSEESFEKWNSLFMWAGTAFISNTCWNVIIYSLFNSRLRKAFRQQVRKMFRCRN